MDRRANRVSDHTASLVVLGFAFALLLGGGMAHVLGQAAFLGCAGLTVLLRPPQRAPGWTFNLSCLALLGWSLIQLVPGTATTAGWRESLSWAGLLQEPSAAAIAPYAHVRATGWILACLAWVFACLELNGACERSSRRRLLIVFGLGMSALGLLCFALNSMGWINPLAPKSHVFTLLPNRNHTGLLLALGGVVSFALAFERMLRHRIEAVFLLFGATACFLGVMSTTSRAAVLLFLLGVVVWSIRGLSRRKELRRFKLILPFGISLLAVLFALGGVTPARLVGLIDGQNATQGGVARVEIYRDTLGMVPEVLPAGTGWGSFAAVFPYFRQASLNHMAIIHPESDWLWLLVEGGMVATVCVLLILVTFAWTSYRRAETGRGRYRAIPVLCLGLALLHGVVDVPLRNPAVLLFLFWLSGFVCRRATDRENAVRALWIPPRGWRCLGLLLIAAALVWTYGAAARKPWSPHAVRSISLQLLQEGATGPVARDLAEPETWLGTAANFFPYEWTTHSALGRLALQKGDRRSAAEAFVRARAAQNDQGVVTWTEGGLWLPLVTGRALDAYRATFVERDLYDRTGKFEALLLRARQNPGVLAGLGRISREDPSLRWAFFRRANADLARPEVELDMREHPQLAYVPRSQRAEMWWRFGEIVGWPQVDAHFRSYPEAAEESPLIAALARAEANSWREGTGVLLKLIQEAPTTAYGRGLSLEQLRARHRLAPGDVAVALAYLRELIRVGEWKTVVELAENFRPSGGVRYPSALHYWKARGLWELGRHAETAPGFRAYVRQLIEADDDPRDSTGL